MCHPSTADSIPTCDGQEDHVSMGAYAARKFITVLENTENVLSIAMMLAKQAWELRYNQGEGVEGYKIGDSPLDKIFQNLAKDIPYFKNDIFWYKYINIAKEHFNRLPKTSELI